jgi:ribonuclease VapC
VIVIDASAVVAILLGETEAPRLLAALGTVPDRFMSPMSYVETVMALGRTSSQPKAVTDTFLLNMNVVVLTIDREQSELAANAFLFFGKGRHPARLNLGDCFSYAAAKALNAQLLFIGDDFVKTDIRGA